MWSLGQALIKVAIHESPKNTGEIEIENATTQAKQPPPHHKPLDPPTYAGQHVGMTKYWHEINKSFRNINWHDNIHIHTT